MLRSVPTSTLLCVCLCGLTDLARAQDHVEPPRLLSAAELEWPRDQPPPSGPIELVLTVDASGAPADI
ncbi:MAG TPA: hypothetical protein VJV78_24550, partial [Polyangiales bacterium]|nr:hypothetical protein [Polyangiales bacterium]